MNTGFKTFALKISVVGALLLGVPGQVCAGAQTVPVEVIATDSPVGAATIAGPNIWAVEPNVNELAEYSLPTGLPEKTLPVGLSPTALSVDSSHIWVANSGAGTVSEVLISSLKVVQTIKVGSAPTSLFSDGVNVWVANSLSNTVSQISVATGRVIGTVAVGASPASVFSDGSYVWVASSNSPNISVIQVSTGKVIDLVAAGPQPSGIVSDGQNIWVANSGAGSIEEISKSSRTTIATFQIGGQPGSLSFANGILWIADTGAPQIREFNISTGTVVSSLPLDVVPSVVIANGVQAFVGSRSANQIELLQGQQKPQSPVISNIPQIATAQSTFTPSIKTNSDGVTQVSSQTPSICSVSSVGAIVSFLQAGTCVLVPESAETNNFALGIGAAVIIPVVVEPAVLTLSAESVAVHVGDSETVVIATNSDQAATLSSLSPQTCVVDSNLREVSFLKVGGCTIQAEVGADNVYSGAASQTLTITVDPIVGSVSFLNSPTLATVGSSFTPEFGSNSDATEIAISQSTNVCWYDPVIRVVNFIAVGECTIYPHLAAAANVTAALGSPLDFYVSQGEQSPLVIGGTSEVGFTISSIALSVSGGMSDTQPVLTTSGGCHLFGLKLTAKSATTCVVTATSAGNANYLPTSTSQTFTFVQPAQAVVAITNPTLVIPRHQFVALSASGGSGVLHYRFSVSGIGCVIKKTRLSNKTGGDCVVTATNPANHGYTSATSVPVTFSFS